MICVVWCLVPLYYTILYRTCLVRRARGGGDDDDVTMDTLLSSKYDLLANICHDSAVWEGVTIVTDSRPPAKGGHPPSSSGKSLTGD
jgi:hypothetical protein